MLELLDNDLKTVTKIINKGIKCKGKCTARKDRTFTKENLTKIE